MTRSSSTPRLRLTQAFYLLVLGAAALSDGRLLEGAAGVASQAAGFALVVAAVLGRIWTTLFIAGGKDAELVQSGPYAACRHPLYLASTIAAFGIGLTTRSLVLSAALPLAVAIAAIAAARREDKLLSRTHGERFRAYRDAVPAFWPSGRSHSPATVSVPPAIYRKAFLDGAAFLALWLLVLLQDGLRAGGAWQALFRLP